MTKDEFEQGYAQRSGITVERLHELGRHAEPCDCGDESCQGWQMTHSGAPLRLRYHRNVPDIADIWEPLHTRDVILCYAELP